uniref:RING-type domain-containing protein n=1 Tax=Caenorhabditis tropicalis TaxID=1561998 RepID=A0A1I7T2N6_9PELO
MTFTPTATIYLFIQEKGFRILNNEEIYEFDRIRVVERPPQDLSDSESLDLEMDSSASESPDDEEELNFSYKDLKCSVCLEQYSSTRKKRIPRILKSCGHTTCYGCAKKLETAMEMISCPLCGKYTFESAKDLPKNYLAIGLMDEIKLSGK